MSAPADTKPADGKKVFIQTWGCQMNVYDSTRIGDALENEGYAAATSVDDADLVLLNTCHIRERAADKVYSHLGRIRQAKDARAGGDRPLTVGVVGCVAQAEGAEIVARERAVDLVAGPQTYHRIGAIVAEAANGTRPVETGYEIDDKFEKLRPASKRQVAARGVTAFLTVQEGCDKFCTFCVVPYTRGAEVSRERAAIVQEARDMAAAGVREITLLGQNVNAWHGTSAGGAQVGLGELLHELAGIEGIARLRYVTSHPRDMKGPRGDALIAAHRDLPTLMPYLHLPVQAGSDRILKAMNRRHTAAEYVALIARIREARPDLAVSGDFIVGFPGESDADFEATLAIVEATNYAQAYSFKYSTRPGTPAADLGTQVPEPVKAERLQRLQALLNAQQQAFNTGLVGMTMDVLIDKPGKLPGQMIARSPWLQSVVLDPSSDGTPAGNAGDLVTVRVDAAHANSLAATPAARPPAPKDTA